MLKTEQGRSLARKIAGNFAESVYSGSSGCNIHSERKLSRRYISVGNPLIRARGSIAIVVTVFTLAVMFACWRSTTVAWAVRLRQQ